MSEQPGRDQPPRTRRHPGEPPGAVVARGRGAGLVPASGDESARREQARLESRPG